MNTKTAIVTGASKGIGKAVSKKLQQEGWTVIGIARTFEEDTLSGERFIPKPMDLEQLDSLPSALKELKKEFPCVDALVLNAGKGQFCKLEEFSFKQMHALINLNFLSCAYFVKAYLPCFKQKQAGDIIFMGSEAALTGRRMGSLYCASKFALRGFAQALRDECAKDGIRICLINPGMVETTFFDHLSFQPGEDSLEHIEPQDIADLVAHLLHSRRGTVFDEINMAPQKKKIIQKPVKNLTYTETY